MCLLTQCKYQKDTATAEGFLPQEPNYGDTSQWYVTDRNAPADIFYVISTETGDYMAADGSECHFANTYSDSLRAPLYGEMLGVDTLLSGRLNYFSPYYRQCSLQTFVSDSTVNTRYPIALEDVRRAFGHYFTTLNHGRPFILAGFSQGAMIVLDLLREMDEETYSRMIAAYVFGTVVTQQMVDECSHIVGARRDDDTGVTICYNSVRDADCADPRHGRSAIAINPVNWKTDATEALLITEPTPLLPVVEQSKDQLKVHLDSATNLLFVSGYTATDYQLPLIGQEGNYHSREIWLYRHHLRDNMALRAEAFLKKGRQ